MCGIAGLFHYRGDSFSPLDDELRRIHDAMRNRGPDAEGIWLHSDLPVGLSHRRLAIVDLSAAGNQPMTSSDGALRITFNGEIYNYRALRAQLEALGHRFRTESDTEVLLVAYLQFGESMVARLRGMFAFAIWDERRKGVFLARDHFGIKPLYFWDDGKVLRFASQVKALMAGGSIPASLNPAGQVGFFLWGYVPEPYTMYRDVFELPAGHSLWVDSDGARTPKKYFDIADELAQVEPASKPIEGELALALKDSVRAHLLADVPVGVFLSAGLDSCTVAAIASEFEGNLNAITIGFTRFQGSPEDETQLARKVASGYAFHHSTIEVSDSEVLAELPSILDCMDQPSIDGVNTYFVAKAARQMGLKVALSGLGGDELLGGYPSFADIPRLVRFSSALSRVPGLGVLSRLAMAPLVPRTKSQKVASVFEYGGSFGGAYLLRRALYLPWEMSAFLDPDVVREGMRTLAPVSRINEWIRPIRSSRARVAAMEFSYYMRGMLLRDADWAGMAHSVEIRTPFVDVDVFRAMAPHIVSGKFAPRKVDLHGIPSARLPREITERRKTGFTVPNPNLPTRPHARSNAIGLRDWSHRVANVYHGHRVSPRRTVLALLHDAFGGRGGIAKFNQDLLWAAASSPDVEQVVGIPRRVVDGVTGLPLKLRFPTHATSSKLRYAAISLVEARRYRPSDVVCGHLKLLPLAWVIARICGSRLLCVIHGIDAWQPNGWLVNRLVLRVDQFVSVSEVTTTRFAHWSGVPPDRIRHLPNCFDPHLYFPDTRNRQLQDRLGVTGKKVLLTMGRLVGEERYKGFDEVLEVLSEVKSVIPEVAYIIAGGGADQARLSAKAQQLGHKTSVIFTGYVLEEEKADLYRLADLYVMPSRGEGFGIVFLEALACGVPAIGSKIDGSREALLGGRLGALVDPNSKQELLAAILSSLGSSSNDQVSKELKVYSLGAYRDRVRALFADAQTQAMRDGP